jgi:hypothetical protein
MHLQFSFPLLLLIPRSFFRGHELGPHELGGSKYPTHLQMLQVFYDRRRFGVQARDKRLLRCRLQWRRLAPRTRQTLRSSLQTMKTKVQQYVEGAGGVRMWSFSPAVDMMELMPTDDNTGDAPVNICSLMAGDISRCILLRRYPQETCSDFDEWVVAVCHALRGAVSASKRSWFCMQACLFSAAYVLMYYRMYTAA